MTCSRAFARTVGLLGCVTIVTLHAQQPTPRELFERARILEESNRNLDEAAAIYGQVATQSTDRELAATALLRIGLLHERRGRAADAQRSFQAVIAGYSDQAAVVQQARARIREANEINGAPTALALRQVWTGPQVDVLGSVSPDGRLLSFVDWETGDLAIRDLVSGDNRRLTNKGSWESPEFALFSRISPDGRLIAYNWMNNFGWEIRVAYVDGSSHRVVFSTDAQNYAQPETWSPDGKLLAVLLSTDINQIGLIDVAGGPPRVLKSFDWRLPANVHFSPDGKYLAYDFPPGETSPERDVYVLASDGSREVRLVEHEADDYVLAWLPDGRILFASDRSGTTDAWVIAVSEGRDGGAPALLKKDLGNVFSLGATRAASLSYGLKVGGRDVYTATLDPQTGRVIAPSSRVAKRFIGANFEPDWSPDGRRLAYVSERTLPASRIGGQVLCIADLESGLQRELPLRLGYVRRPRWSPDARSILFRANERGRPALLLADAESGRPTVLFRHQGLQLAEWSPDGNTVFILANEVREAGSQTNQASWITALNVKNGTDRQLFQETSMPPVGDALINDLSVSPDGRLMAFTVIRNKAKLVMTMSTQGGEPHEIFRSAGDFQVPSFAGLSWTPDGREILVVKQGSAGEQELWALPVQGGSPRPMSVTGNRLRGATIHPTGRQIAFQAGSDAWEVWVLDNVHRQAR